MTDSSGQLERRGTAPMPARVCPTAIHSRSTLSDKGDPVMQRLGVSMSGCAVIC